MASSMNIFLNLYGVADCLRQEIDVTYEQQREALEEAASEIESLLTSNKIPANTTPGPKRTKNSKRATALKQSPSADIVKSSKPTSKRCTRQTRNTAKACLTDSSNLPDTRSNSLRTRPPESPAVSATSKRIRVNKADTSMSTTRTSVKNDEIPGENVLQDLHDPLSPIRDQDNIFKMPTGKTPLKLLSSTPHSSAKTTKQTEKPPARKAQTKKGANQNKKITSSNAVVDETDNSINSTSTRSQSRAATASTKVSSTSARNARATKQATSSANVNNSSKTNNKKPASAKDEETDTSAPSASSRSRSRVVSSSNSASTAVPSKSVRSTRANPSAAVQASVAKTSTTTKKTTVASKASVKNPKPAASSTTGKARQASVKETAARTSINRKRYRSPLPTPNARGTTGTAEIPNKKTKTANEPAKKFTTPLSAAKGVKAQFSKQSNGGTMVFGNSKLKHEQRKTKESDLKIHDLVSNKYDEYVTDDEDTSLMSNDTMMTSRNSGTTTFRSSSTYRTPSASSKKPWNYNPNSHKSFLTPHKPQSAIKKHLEEMSSAQKAQLEIKEKQRQEALQRRNQKLEEQRAEKVRKHNERIMKVLENKKLLEENKKKQNTVKLREVSVLTEVDKLLSENPQKRQVPVTHQDQHIQSSVSGIANGKKASSTHETCTVKQDEVDVEKQRVEEEKLREEKQKERKLAEERLKAEEAEKKKLLEEEERKKQKEAEEKAKFEILRQQKMQMEEERRLAEEAKKLEEAKKASADAYSRIMLPPCRPESLQTYYLGDLTSDEETDDDSTPKHQIPSWALSKNLVKIFARQNFEEQKWWTLMRPSETMNLDADIKAMFPSTDITKKCPRSSSAIWSTPPGQSLKKIIQTAGVKKDGKQ